MRTPLHLTALIALLAAAPAAHALVAPAAPLPIPLQDDEESEDGEEEEEEDEHVAIVGGDVYTGTGAVLRGATIHGKNGKIAEIGYDLWLPEDTELIDARGMSVYPGLVTLSATSRISSGLFAADPLAADGPIDSHYGIDDGHEHGPEGYTVEDEADAGFAPSPIVPLEEAQAQRQQVGSRRDQARVRAEDAYDPLSEYLVLALAAGVTTADQSGVATKLRRDTFEGTFLNDDTQVTISWSKRNPQSITSTRERFARAAEYLREYRAWEELDDDEVDEPSKSGVDSNALRVLRAEAFARFNNDDREELLGIARFAQQYNFRPVIWGAREGWTVADDLGRAGAFAVVTPRDRRPKPENLVRPGGSSIENAAKLHAAGVQVAIIPQSSSFDLSGITGRDLSNLPLEAGFAVRGGLPEQAAFEAITIVPARLMGVDHRVGTLEPGKDFDALVCDGDIMHYETFVQVAIVEGKVAYDKDEEIFYAHIRPRPELPPLDPGEILEGGTGGGDEAEGEASDDEDGDSEDSEGEDSEGGDDEEGDDEEGDGEEGDGED